MTDLGLQLEEFRTAWAARVGDGIAGIVRDDITDLRSSGILDRAARAGDRFPDVALPDARGRAASVAALAADGPVVATFYRGGWCPYCNIELRAYQQRLDAFRELGARLVAISPERPDEGAETALKNGLGFPVLSDAGGRLADALGIRFRLSPRIEALYRRFGHDLPAVNGDGEWALPMPATFVVARGGRIRAAFVDPDYRVRTDPEDALAVLRADARAAA
jgi:peroxiredoxin